MNNKITDQDIDIYLKGHTELSETYAESKHLNAPDHLEMKIKRLARADNSVTVTSGHSASNKDIWFFPLTMAASFIMAITLTFALYFQKDDVPLMVENKTNSLETLSGKQQAPTTLAEQQQNDSRVTASTDKEISSTAEVSKNQETASSPQVQQTLKNKSEQQNQLASESVEFELPPHLQEAIQPTHAVGKDKLPPAEVLKSWTRQQWQEQIETLNKAGKNDLVEKFIKAYPTYFPGEKLQLRQ